MPHPSSTARPTTLIACFLMVWMALSPTAADAAEDWFEPGALGMGGAIRVLGGSVSAIRTNPAAMASQKVYLTGLSYSYYGRRRTHIFSSGAYDSKSSAFTLGTTYSVHISTPPWDPGSGISWFQPDSELRDTRTTHRWEVAGAYALLDHRINFGFGVRILRNNFSIRANSMRISMDTGVTLFPVKFLGFGVSIANFIPTKDDRYATRLSGGIALTLEDVLDVGVDAVIDLTSQSNTRVDLHGGLTFKALQIVLIRAGYYGDRGFIDNYLTWGLGVKIPTARITINLNYAMRIEVGPMDESLRADRQVEFQRIWNTLGMNLSF